MTRFSAFLLACFGPAALQAQTLDFGDYNGFGNAASTVVTTLKIGASTDKESSATTNATATGDDTTGSDDEDGVTVPATLTQGASASIVVNVTNSTSATAYLNVWIDYNGNGVLTDSGEQIASNTTIAKGTSNSNRTINFTVPTGATPGVAGVRVRLSSTSTPGPASTSGNGEVEDYVTTILSRLDYGDNPLFASATQVANSVIRIGTNATDTENSNPASGTANADDTTGTDDEDLTMPALTAGSTTTLAIPVAVTTGSLTSSTARLNVFADWNGDNDVSDTSETLTTQTVGSSGTYNFSLSPPLSTTPGTKYLRIRITEGSTAPAFSGSSTLKGEVEDYAITVSCPTLSISPTTLTTPTAGQAYSQTLTASGGFGSYVFAVSGGSLPAGLSLDTAAGVISGTATSTSSAAFTIRATDSNGCTSTRSYSLTPAAPTTDFGDHSSLESASSTLNSNLRIGATTDTEAVAASNAAATGDDTTGSDDEDGVTLPASALAGASGSMTVNVTNNTGSTAYLNVWIDFNRDGDLTDGGEQVAANTTIASGTSSSSRTVNFTVPAAAVAGQAAVRVRLTSVSSPGPTGADGNGEVEDHVLSIVPGLTIGNMVWNDANENGIHDPEESGINNVLVELWTPGADNAIGGTSGNADTKIASVTTSGGGLYSFTGLSAGYYFVKVPTAPLSRTSLVVDGADNGQDADNNGSQPAGSGASAFSPVVQLAIGAEPGSSGGGNTDNTIDFGFASNIGSPFACDNRFWIIQNDETSPGSDMWDTTLYYMGEGPTLVPTFVFSGYKLNGLAAYGGYLYCVDQNGNHLYRINSQGVLVDMGAVSGLPSPGADGQWSGATALTSGRMILNLYGFSPASTKLYTIDLTSASLVGSPVTVTNTSTGSNYSGNFGDIVWDPLTGKVYGYSTVDDNWLGLFEVNMTTGAATRVSAAVPGSWGSMIIDANGLTYGFGSAGASGDQDTLYVFNRTNGVLNGSITAVGVGPPVANSDGAACPGAPPSMKLGNLVWNDANNNGVKDSGEAGIDGVSLQLFMGGQNPQTATPIATVTTSGGGLYSFNNLSPGQYFIQIPTPPAAYPLSSTTSDALDNGEDHDDNGTQASQGQAVTSPFIALAGGTEPVNDGDTDANSDLSIDFGFLACPAVTVSPSGSLTAATVGSAYSQSFTAVGGLSPYTWAVSSGTLPGGLSLSSAGVLSGTATSSSAFAFTVRATDARGCVGTRSYTMAPVCPALTITPAALAAGTVGSSYNQSLGAGGGTSPYGFALTSGSLPAGLTLSSAGVVTGTPTASNGSGATFTVRATDTYGCQATQSISLKICPVVTLSPTSLPLPTVGMSYSTTLSGNGGATPYTFAVSSGSLPAGLSLSTSNGVISGIATSTTAATFTIRATDANGCSGTRAYSLTPAPNTDFGDFSAFSSASNTTNGTLKIGATIDAEVSATTNSSATGDDSTGSDDEDGVAMPASITAGAQLIVPVVVSNTSGADAYLNAWIDFNNNGSPGDGGEQVATNILVASGTTSATVNVNFTVPVGASVGSGRGVRFRLTSAASPGFLGSGTMGEVEDYVVSIAAPTLDFGDYLAFGSASSTRNSTLRIGASVDAEGSASTNGSANGDDTTGSDDEDGVTVPASITQGNSGSITVNVSNGTGSAAYLNVWIDFNGNGVLTDSGEQVATNTNIAAGTSNSNRTVSFTVPALVKTGPVGLRARMTSTSSPGSVGQSGSGEVEDHLITIVANTDFGDHPLFAAASSKTNSTLRIGALVDSEGSSMTDADATGDDLDGSDDEDGAAVPVTMTQGAPTSFNVTVTNSSASVAYLNAWIDFNRNGVLTDSGEQVAVNTTVNAGTSGGLRTVSFNVPASASLGEAGVRVRLTSVSSPGPDGLDGNGEVEDYLTTVVVPLTDFGDDVDFADASSQANSSLKLGALVDVEGAATKNAAASGDDSVGVDDEDAVFFPPLTAGQPVVMPVAVTNLTGSTAYLNAWIDFNNNGVLTDAGEVVVANVAVPAGTDGDVEVSFNVPTNAVTAAASVGARFRLTSASNPGSTGASGSGEVEDHQVVILAPLTDFGDHSAYANVSNTASTNLRLGTSVDTEYAATRNATATGDDVTGVDDEDGVTVSAMTAGGPGSLTVNVTNTTGAIGYLNAWVDFNNNGSFADSGEQVMINGGISNGTLSSNVSINFTVPPAAVTETPVGVRVRITSDISPGISGAGGVGEVEDHTVTIATPTTDFGDFLGFADASSLRNSSLKLGATTDTEYLSTRNNSAAGDDTTGGDDEDAVTLPGLTAGAPATIPVVVTNTTGSTAYLNAWIDYNNNGVLTDAGEQIAVDVPVSTGASGVTQNLSFNVSAISLTGVSLGARFRLTSTLSPGPTGASGNGEVEDYLVNVLAPTTDYGDFNGFANASQGANPALRLGQQIDTEYNPTRNANANGDDNVGIDDEDAVTLPAMTAGQTVTIPVLITNVTGATGYLNVWFDYNNNGILTEAGEQVATNMAVPTGTTSGTVNVTTTVPPNAVTGTPVGIRFRLSAPSGLGPTGTNDLAGEIEDYEVTIAAPTTDFGDFLGFADASSTRNSSLKIGATTDTEYLSTRNATASGDDATGGDDEDGVTLPALTAGRTATIPVVVTNTTGSTAYLNAWIDFNNNGLLTDAGEQVATNVAVTGSLSGVTQNLNITVPGTAVTGVYIGARFRLTSTGSPGATGASGSGEVEDYIVSIIAPATDFGDYSRFASASNATSNALRLGVLIDNEGVAANNATATGDDTAGSDDEDGVTPPVMTAGQTLTLPVVVTNTTGANAYLNVWIDFNDNGALSDAGEQVVGNLTVGTGNSNLTVNPSISIPASAPTGVPLGMRVRLTAVSTPGATGELSSLGEVEDYLVTVQEPTADFGDFLSFGDASSLRNSSLRIGATTDTEYLSTRNATATGDDATGSDDEDGVTMPALTAGAPATIPVVVTNTTASTAYLNAWIDFNNNGVLTDAGEQVAVNVAVNAGTSDGVQNLGITVPATALTGINLGVRFRLTSTLSPGSTGASGQGEVEDHVVNIALPPLDYGDHSALPDASSTASSALRLGGSVDTEYTATFTALATGDDSTGGDDEDGVGVLTMTAGAPVTIPVAVTNTTGSAAYLNVWMDFNNNGVATDPGEQVATDVSIATGISGGTQNLSFTVPATAVTGANLAIRFRLTSVSSPGISGNVGVGEVEDYVTTIAVPTTDFGDWNGAGDASSIASSNLRMGALADTEYVSTRNAGATGDDLTASDDEDGVTLAAGYNLGASSSLTVVTTNFTGATGYLNAWVDWNGNGVFTDSGEQIAINRLIASGTSASTQNINFTVPSAAIPGGRGARFRLTSVQNPTPLGAVGTGEVEDYLINIYCPTVTVTPASLTTPMVGTAYSATFTASGGIAPHVFTVSSGSLPAGLTLNSSTGVLSGTPTSSASQTFTISATDLNSCQGTRSHTLAPACPTISITPVTATQGTVGVAYSRTLAASGGTAPYGSWTLTSGSLPAGLSLNAGTGVISGTPSAMASPAVSVTVRVTDAYGCQGTQAVTIQVCPVITVSPASLATPTVGTAYSATVSASGGTGPYSFTISSGSLPAWATLNPGTGVISGTPNSAAAASFTVRATDANGCSATRALTLSPVCPALSITPVTPAAGVVGAAYSQTMSVTGGTGPFIWTVVSGSLPAGLSLSTGGVIAGTPTASNGAGVSVTLRATDIYGCARDQAVVFKACPVISLSPAGLTAPTVGTAYSQAVAADGGTTPYSYSIASGTLPGWATLNAGTGVISGTPNSTATAAFTVRVTDANGCTGTLAYSLTPACPAVTLSPGSLANGTVGTAYSQTLSGSGGSAPYTFAVSSGSLPAWATLNTSTGVISGTPSSTAAASFTIAVTDTYGCQGTRSYTITPVCPAITVSPASAANSTLGLAYTQTLSATGGTAPYAWTTIGGTWPAGLSLNSDGVISGIPTAANGAGASVTVRAVDAYGCSKDQDITIKVCPVIALSPASLAAPTVGTGYNATVSGGNGAAPYTYAVASGSLPAGLTLSTGTGVISGLPTSASGTSFTLRVTDANGCIGTRSYTLTAVCPTISITPTSAANGTLGIAYSQPLAASGGTAPYTGWTVTSGTLPAGLSLSSSSGVISGTPTASNGAGVNVTVRATDTFGCQGSQVVSIKICPVITVSPTTMSTATVGAAFSQTFTSSGGSGGYTYSVSSGSLPAWATLTSGGVLSGTPNSGASATFTIRSTDSNGCAGTRSYTLTPVCPAITVSPSTLPYGIVGGSYSQTISASGGISPYSWTVSAGTLPPGLTLSSAGSLSGTPTTAGTYAFTLRATDTRFCTGSRSYSMVVHAASNIGNLVWNDANNNGVKDTGEAGIDGITVTLWYDANSDGDFVDSGESAYATTVTSGGGSYQFSSVPAGRYKVVIASPPPATPWASRDVDLNDNQEDNDSNGYQRPIGGPVTSPTFDIALGESDSTLDIGLVPPATADERMVMYLADLNLDIIHKFVGSGSTGIEIPGAWGGTPWVRSYANDSGHGITNPHGVWFNGQSIYVGGQRNGVSGTYRYNLQGQLQGTSTSTYRLTHVTLGGYIYYPRDSYVSVNSLTTGSELGRVNLTGTNAVTWGISVGADGFLYVADNYQSSTFPNGSSYRGSGKVFRIDPKPSTFTSPATRSYSAIISGLNDLTGIDVDNSGNIYTAEVAIFDNPPTESASTLRKFSPQGTLLATYQEPTPLNNAAVEDAWGLRWNPVDNKIYVATRYGDCVARLRADTLAYDGAFIGYVPSSYGKTLSLQIESASLDFGDLPDTSSSTGALNYQTAQENSGPTHVINSNLRLGDLIDGEHAAMPANNALGDDNDNRDDEDSIATMPAFVKGQTITLPVKVYNQSGTTAYLVTMFDWNMDGDFVDSGERIQTSVVTGTDAEVNVSVPVPTTALTSMNLGMRLRLSTTSGLTANGAAGNGEVEDYIINVVCPVISLSPTTLDTPVVGSAYSDSVAASGGSPSYTYAVSSGTLPGGLTLSSAGVISGTPTGTTSATFTVRATDVGGCIGTQTYTLAPVCPAITLSPASLATPVTGTAYSATITASGGKASYTFAITSGSLPGGLSMSTAGVISGTPTSTAAASFTVRATDAYGCTATRSYSLTPTCPTISISPTSAANGTLGIAYSQTLSAGGGLAPYGSWTINSGALPAGLSLNAGTGVISGTPTATASPATSLAVRVTDAAGCIGTQTISIKICPVVTLSSSLTTPTVGASYSVTVGVSGGTAPYTLAVTSGSLPAWATLNTSTWVISGTPTSTASASFTLRATDANGCSGTRSYTLTPACPTIFPVPVALPAATVGSAYSQTLAPAGGTAPYSAFTITSGTLPTGLTLTSAGVLSGTPGASNGAGTSVTIRVTDAYGCQGSQAVTVRVCPVITVSPSALSNGTVGANYSAAVSASGGTSPYIYAVSSGTLPSWASLSASTGAITGTPNSNVSASFTIRATDANGCTGTRSYTVTPVCPTLTISNASLPPGSVGVAYNQTLSVTGGTGPYTWTVSSGTLPDGLTLGTGGLISGTPTTGNGSGVSLTFRATDSYGCQVTKTLTLKVCAAIALAPAALPDGVTGSPYSQTVTASNGTSPYVYAIASGTLPAGLALNSSTGVISGTPTANVSANITVSATDSVGCAGTRSYTLSIGCPSMDISPAALSSGLVGTAYSQTMTASGGTGPYTWTVSSGTLPSGLGLSSAGVISGTPTTANGTGVSVTLRALDSTGCAVTRDINFQVCPVITVNPATLSTPVVGTAYSQTFSGGGGTAPYVFDVSSGSLPAWATLNSSTGELSGLPVNTTAASFTIRATDANGCSATRAHTLTPSCPTISLAPTSLPAGSVGSSYSQTLSASGGTGPYSGWTVTSGTLPAGLTLNSGTGLISGTPTSSNGAGVSITVRASDSYGCQGSRTYTIKICPVISLTPTSLSAATVGTAYNQTVAGSGGAAPYTFTVSSGSLPAWATLNGSTGAITGTPTSTTGAVFSIRATDANGCSGTRAYSITPACPTITVSPATLAMGSVGSAYSQSLAASGGTAPYTWTTLSGTWPAGLSLSSAGVVSGTPTSANGSGVTVTVRATDAYGCIRDQSVSLMICPAISLSPSSLTAPVVGTAYSAAVAASGGASPYTFAVVSGSLPAWASLNPATGEITGLPVNTTAASFTIRATAANGCIGTRAYTLTPVCPAISISPTTFSGYLATPLSQNLVATGGTSGYTWSIASGSLPAGLSLSSGGVISGTPSAGGTTSVTLRVTDAYGCQSTQDVSILIRSLTLGDIVWQDNNNNGLLDSGEPGVAGAVVQLMNPGDDNAIGGTGSAADVQVGALVTTGTDGRYSFNSLSPGSYYLRVLPPNGFHNTSGTPSTADDDIDNNNDGSQPGGPGTPLFSPVITLSQGTESVLDGDTDTDTNHTVDFGLWASLSVGNFVFLDIDGDGRRNSGESLPYVYIQLYREGDTPGVDPPYTVSSAGCGCKGRYIIENIDPGRYFIYVPPSQFTPGMPLEGLLPMNSVVAGDDDVGQDLLFNDNPSVNGARTAVFTLTPGQAPVGAQESGEEGSIDDDNDSNIDLTKDLGFASPSGSGFALAQRDRRTFDEDLTLAVVDNVVAASTPEPAAEPANVTFAAWSETHPDTDGDLLDQLLEYALDTNPADGRSGAGVFGIEATALGTADVFFSRPANGRPDIRHELQMSLDGQVWGAVGTSPVLSIGNDGRQIVRYAAVDAATVGPRAFFRLKVMLDANLDGVAEAVSLSQVVMFSRETFPVGQRTFSMPLVKPELFAGAVTLENGAVILPVAVTLDRGAAYHLEDLATGRTYEVDEAASTGSRLVLEGVMPAVMARAALRPHHMLSSLFGTDILAAGTEETADRVLTFDPAANAFTSTWLAVDGWSDDFIIGRQTGLMVHVRNSEVTLLLTGQAALKPQLAPSSGTRLIGSASGLAESPHSLGLSSANGFRANADPAEATRLRLWKPDADAAQTGYDSLHLSPDGWLRQDDPAPQVLTQEKLLPAFHAFFLMP